MPRRVLIMMLVLDGVVLLLGGGWVLLSFLMRRTYARSMHEQFGQAPYDAAVSALDRLGTDLLLGSMLILGLSLCTVLAALFMLFRSGRQDDRA
ncbi:MAG: hypothetical protein ACF8LL_10915 [Phycisphaerales bacterium]